MLNSHSVEVVVLQVTRKFKVRDSAEIDEEARRISASKGEVPSSFESFQYLQYGKCGR